VEANLQLVTTIARRVQRTHRQLDIEDLRGAGYVGLVQAAERYTREHNAAFQTFAYSRIQGEMLELARRRQLRENSGDPLPATEIRDQAAGGAVEAIEVRQRVAAILGRLTDKERGVLISYFLQNGTLKALGEKLGCSTSQAGRILRETIGRARRVEARAA
jgi:RNA polymerase sigma factor for flagellar operon FliA